VKVPGRALTGKCWLW